MLTLLLAQIRNRMLTGFLVALGALGGIGVGGASSASAAGCQNEAFRVGPSASLPDCRAYELVTPPDSDGRLFYGLKSALPYSLFPTELASSSRDSVLFMTLGGPLGEPPQANGTYDLYEAKRSSSGWETSRRLSPSGSQGIFPNAGGASSDHLYAFSEVGPVEQTRDGGSLATEGNAEYLSNPDGSFELVGIGSLGTERLAQGRFISPGGEHIIFTTGGAWCSLEGSNCSIRRLEPAAPPTGTPAIYDRAPNGPTKVVSLLPDGSTPGEAAEYQGASADGSAVAFKIGDALYVRLDDEVTVKAATGPTVFAGLSSDGSELLYVLNGDIYAFDTETRATLRATTSGDAEIANVSADGSHVYFVSPSQLDGLKGAGAEPNLYVWAVGEETITFVATVSRADLEGEPALTNWTDSAVLPSKFDDGQGPGSDSSRTTSDGRVLLFESKAELTGYNTAGHTQIYRYDALTKVLQCVSCSPLGTEAREDARLEAVKQLGAAAVIHNISADGSRAFFETPEALVAGDTDGLNDIYQWREPSSPGQPATINLISSGKSPRYSTFDGPLSTNIIFGITRSGSDVVFLAYEQLVPAAGQKGVPALYDARESGGFPAEAQVPGCVGEACQGPADAGVLLASPGSSSLMGAGNVGHKKHRCHRPHHRSKAKARKAERCHGHKRPSRQQNRGGN